MNERNLWDSINHPTVLADMVHVGWVQRLLRSADWMGFPGPESDLVIDGQTRVEAHARRVFDKFAELGIEYVAEPTDSEPGAQRIRPVNEVLAFRKATCVDLCVAFCCAALDAGIYPLILTVTADGGQRRHAIVLVPMERQWAMGCDVLIDEGFSRESMMPGGEDLRDLVVGSADDPGGTWLAIDVQQVTESDGNWKAALFLGAEYVHDWEWDVCVDVGGLRSCTPDRELPPGGHIERVLAPAYAELPEDFTSLQLIKARHGVVPYQQRAEMRQLREWAMTVPSDSRTGRNGRNADISVAVVTGAGGSGKTRMAAQLCHDLSKIGWYTGFLPSTTEVTDEELAALTAVTTELLVVVDYAEEARRGLIARVVRKLRARESATRIVLTARGAETWWEEFYEEAEQDGTVLSNTLSLSIRGKQQVERDPWFFGRMYRRAVQRFSYDLNGVVPTDVEVPESLGDTALDVVLRACLAVYAEHDGAGRGTLTRGGLYDRVLSVEFAQWRKTPILTEISTSHMRRAAATLSLLAPSRDEDVIDDVLSRLPEWNREHLLRSRFAELLVQSLLRDDGAEAVSLRPDPVAEHLILTVFGKKPELLDRVLPQHYSGVADSEEANLDASIVEHATELEHQAYNVCVALTRAASLDEGKARHLAGRVLRCQPALWRKALDVALNQGGPFASALEGLISSGVELPLAEIEDDIPLGHGALRGVARAATEHLMKTAEGNPAEQARWANTLAIRLSEDGHSSDALDVALKAVRHYRNLVSESHDMYLPELAMSLNTLATILSEVGNSRDGVVIAREAVDLYRGLADISSEEYKPALALSLNTLANSLSEIGNSAQALVLMNEAVEIYRELNERFSQAFDHKLAGSLNNLATILSELGQMRAALVPAQESVELYRGMVEKSPQVFTHNLAGSLNTLASFQSEMKEYDKALVLTRESVGLYRGLTDALPEVYQADLAMSLNTLAIILSEEGNFSDALVVARESVKLFRGVGKTPPMVNQSHLAGSLNTLATILSAVGDSHDALVVVSEAVKLYRRLADESCELYKSDLAMSLNTQANRLLDVGENTEALVAAHEAVCIYRELADTSPQMYGAALAMSLNTQAIIMSEVGDSHNGLKVALESVRLYRGLTEGSHDVYKPNLAMSLNTLAIILSYLGEKTEALMVAREAVELYRELVEISSQVNMASLAASINTLANVLSDAGDSAEALVVVGEAVELYRGLAEDNPQSFFYDLAGALNNLANRLSEVGECHEAMIAASEALKLFRELFERSPHENMPDLAMALNNQSIRMMEVGEFRNALEMARESVELYRRLAVDSPDMYRADLAMSLNTLANCLSQVGERAVALESAREAVDLYRVVVKDFPETYQSDLAVSSHTLANCLLDVGERDEAEEMAREAVELYRVLAAASPQTCIANLAASLKTLASILTARGHTEEAMGVFVEGFDHLSPALRAHLLLARATWREGGRESEDLVAAAKEADSTDAPALLGGVRRMISQVINEWGIRGTGFPRWATVTVDSMMSSRIEAWLQCGDPEQRAAFLKAEWASPSDSEREALAAVADLFVDVPAVGELTELVGSITEDGIEAVVSRLRCHHRAQVLAHDWHRTHTGGQGAHFLREHMRVGVGAPRVGGGNNAAMKTDPAEWDRDLSDPAMRSAVQDVLAAELPDTEATRMGRLLELADLSDPATAYEAYGSDEGAEDSLRHFLESHNWRAMLTVLRVRPGVADSAHGRIAALLDAAAGGESTERLRELYDYANEAMDAIDRRHLQALLVHARVTDQCPKKFSDLLRWNKA